MKRTTFVHIDGLPYAVTRDQLTDVLLSGGRHRYAIVDETLEEPGLCIKHVRLIDEDADTVERLFATDGDTLEKEPIKPKSPWIPVAERLPQDDDGKWGSIVSVLVTVQPCSLLTGEPSKPFVTSAAYDIEQRIFDVGGLGAVNAVLFESDKPRLTITHWMPMPVSAKEWKEVTK